MANAPVRVLAAVIILFCLRTATSATTIVPLTFDELVQGAREIFAGEVVDTRSRFVNTRDGRAIVTLVTFKVRESFKGGLQTQTSLEFLGGTIGDVTFEVVGVPVFRIGDRDVVFVGSRMEVSPIAGVMQGRFRVALDPTRGIDTVRGYDGRAIATLAEIGQPRRFSLRPVASMSLSEFRAAILARIPSAGGVR